MVSKARLPLIVALGVALLSFACGDAGQTLSVPVAPSAPVPVSSSGSLIDRIVDETLADASTERDDVLRAESEAALTGSVSAD